MTKRDFVRAYAKRTGLKRKEAEEAVEAFVETLVDTFLSGEDIRFQGLGKFTVYEKAARNGFNPNTMERIVIPPSIAVKFKMADSLKDLLNDYYSENDEEESSDVEEEIL